MRRAFLWLPCLVIAPPLFAQPASLVPREPLASLRIDRPREASTLAPLFAGPGGPSLWGAAGLPPLEGLDPDAPWYVFLSEREKAPRLSLLVALADPESFERSLLGASQRVGFDREGRHALVGALPLPATGGRLPAHRPGEMIELTLRPRRIVGAFRDDIESFLLASAAQEPRLEAGARGDPYRPPFELDGLRARASTAFGAITTVLEQLDLVGAQLKLAMGLLSFDATFTFTEGSDVARALGEQPLARPVHLLELDPALPYQQWSNLRLGSSPALRRLVASWVASQTGIEVESAEEVARDGERAFGLGATFTETEIEVLEWPATGTLSDYRSTLREIQTGAATDVRGVSTRYEPEVFRTEDLVVDRLTLSSGSDEPRDALARLESYLGWTGTKVVLGQSAGESPERGFERVKAAARREPAERRGLENLLSSTPGKLLWLSRFDLGRWDHLVQKDVPSEDRLDPLESREERPMVLLFATSYAGTLEVGGWIDPAQQAARAARIDALSSLADRYYEKGHSAGEEAILWYGRAARLGHAGGQVALGRLYQRGQGAPRDVGRAAHWYRAAAAQGEPDGALGLGELYETGRGGPRDFEKARFWYGTAAALGDAEGQFRLGRLYEKGEGLEKNLEKALEWYRRAGDQGHARAENAAGILYQEGDGVPRDLDEAERWYRLAAEQGHVPAMANLGDLLLYDRGDASAGVAWLRKAADGGSDYGRYHLARALEDGRGVTRDVAAAMEIFTLLSGEPGDYQQLARYRRGLLLEKEHPDEARTAFREAAEVGLVRAQLRLYRMLFEGRGGAADAEAALGWLRKAAEDDLASAAMLGWHLMTGNGTAKDEETGVALFARAAEAGNAQAQFWLATAYEQGDGVGRDPAEAARWHRAAAQQGHPMAQVRLAGQYLSGNGVEQDYPEAYAWLVIARESGSEEARKAATELIEGLVPSMSAEQILRGEALASERR